jgi:type IV secretory pathway VirB10-like protein
MLPHALIPSHVESNRRHWHTDLFNNITKQNTRLEDPNRKVEKKPKQNKKSAQYGLSPPPGPPQLQKNLHRVEKNEMGAGRKSRGRGKGCVKRGVRKRKKEKKELFPTDGLGRVLDRGVGWNARILTAVERRRML